jgi:hypothetical protein
VLRLNFLSVTVFVSSNFVFWVFVNICICVVRLNKNIY